MKELDEMDSSQKKKFALFCQRYNLVTYTLFTLSIFLKVLQMLSLSVLHTGYSVSLVTGVDAHVTYVIF